MEAYIAAINNYISENKPTVNCPNVDSLLDMLFCCYSQRSCVNSATVRQSFRQLDEILDTLPLPQQDQVVDLTCDLCVEYQKNAFREGVLVGFRLYQELQKCR